LDYSLHDMFDFMTPKRLRGFALFDVGFGTLLVLAGVVTALTGHINVSPLLGGGLMVIAGVLLLIQLAAGRNLSGETTITTNPVVTPHEPPR